MNSYSKKLKLKYQTRNEEQRALLKTIIIIKKKFKAKQKCTEELWVILQMF